MAGVGRVGGSVDQLDRVKMHDLLSVVPGEMLLMVSGRKTSPFPVSRVTSAPAWWLINNAVREAVARRNRFAQAYFSSMEPLSDGSLAKTDCDLIKDYLFNKRG